MSKKMKPYEFTLQEKLSGYRQALTKVEDRLRKVQDAVRDAETLERWGCGDDSRFEDAVKIVSNEFGKFIMNTTHTNDCVIKLRVPRQQYHAVKNMLLDNFGDICFGDAALSVFTLPVYAKERVSATLKEYQFLGTKWLDD